MIFDFLDRIRKQTPRVKKQVAFLVSFSFCGIIFVVWLTVIYPNFRRDQQREAVAQSIEPSPISTFSQTFDTALSAIGEQFSKIKETISTFSTAVEYYSATTSGENMLASPISTSISTTTASTTGE